MRKLVLAGVVALAFSTTAMAIDIAAQTDANWWGSAAAEREMQVVADSVPVSVELFSASQEDTLADWIVAHTGNGQSDLLILTGSFPSSIYGGGNADPDDSIAEIFLDDGNTIINTGDWMFYVSRAGNNAAAGLRNMMDIPGVTMSGSNDTPVELTADGLKYIPSLPEFLTDRPFHLDTLDGDWFPELILAVDATGNLADPVIVKNSVTGGRIGIFMQVNSDNQNDRGRVISEWINNWYLDNVSDPAGAWRPNPADEADDIGRDASLSWRSGAFAATHNVYLSTSFDDVTAADPAVLVGDGLGTTSLDVGRLDFSQTYFWRVDEVNGAPDFGVFDGKIWSFTTEPFSIPISGITATASSSFGPSGPEKTIDGSGLVDDLHGVNATDMWISGAIPATIEYAFDRTYKLHELWIWNSNQLIESFVGFGAKDVVIEHSLDGENWTVLDGVGPLAPATGRAGDAHSNTIDFGGATAQHVRVTVNSVHGIAPQASLSEVRFFFIPTVATRPSPDTGATNVAPDVTLAWGRDGREAGSHDVYVGTDASNLSLAGSVSESSFDTLAVDLQLSQTYHWRVDEINEVMDPSTWVGDLWSFTTADSIPIDDMESYKDEEFLEIWATWVDGFDDPANNGSLVGGAAGIPETDIVHGGRQSLPMDYDNRTAALSEATRTFAVAQDWTRAGVTTLVVWFHGRAGNTGQMYLKVNGTKIPYDGPAENIGLAAWQAWSVDLASSGIDLQSVRSLTVGVEGNGSTGTLYVDDIALVQSAPEAINEWRVAAGNDDAEEKVLDGAMDLGSSDLELGYENATDPANLQTVGIRWVGIAVPRAATITEAWVQFSADAVGSADNHAQPVSMVIKGQLSPNPDSFAATSSISGRPTTSANVVWDIPEWLTVHAMGPEERSPDISGIIQEIVNQADWSGEAIVLIFGDNPANPSQGRREAESFNGSASDAPLLHISFE